MKPSDSDEVSGDRHQSDGADLSLYEDVWWRAQKKLGLYPNRGEGRAFLRVLVFVCLAWLPMVVWALWAKRAFISGTGESLFCHFGIHSRFLIALPVLLLGERSSTKVLRNILPQFEERGLIVPGKRAAFDDVLCRVVRLRNSSVPWVMIAILIVIPWLVPYAGSEIHELDWARKGNVLGFGGWWYLHVARPLFQLVILGWFWRLILVTILLWKIIRLGMDLVPTHPDNLGGMGFLENLPKFFAPLAFACSVILAAHWAHEVEWHGAHVKQYHHLVAVFAVGMLLLSVSPLLVCIPLLKRARLAAMRSYGALVATHGRLVQQRWIAKQNTPDSPLLNAPELGPVADVNTLFESVKAMRILPLGKKSLVAIIIPILIPIMVLYAMEIPLAELLGKIVKTLV